MRTSSLSAAALLVVALGAAGPAAPAQAPAQAPSQASTESARATELPTGPRAYLPEELCDKESLPAGLEHLERLDGLGGPESPDSAARR